MLWFNEGEQDKILIKFFAKGRAYSQMRVKGTNFNNVILWMASGFSWLVGEFNKMFAGLFVCQSSYLIDDFMADYGIPCDTFPIASDNRADVFVLKYLMRGNIAWNFYAVAKAYGVGIKVITGREFFENSRIPNKIPHKLYAGVSDVDNILVVVFTDDDYAGVPYKVPHKLGSGQKLAKIKRVFEIMKEAQVKIIYTKVDNGIVVEVPEIVLCEGDL